MNKQLIVSKTFMFLVLVPFIILFKILFSSDNVLVGVTTATAMLMYLERDLTLSPFKNTAQLIGVNLLIGLASYAATLNTWLALPINFGMVFFLAYNFIYHLRRPIYLPFILQYLFLVATPISFDRLPMRLLALVIGALCIMLLQLLFNKNKLKKAGNKLLIEVCDTLIQQTQATLKHENTSSYKQQIKAAIGQFRNLLYDRRINSFYLTSEARLKFNISAALEKLSFLLDEKPSLMTSEAFLGHFIHLLEQTKTCLQTETYSHDLEAAFEQMIGTTSFKETDCLNTLRFLNYISFLKNHISELFTLKKNHFNSIEKNEVIPKGFITHMLQTNSFRINYMKYSYAFRVALGITVAFFLKDFFHLSEGRWLAFTAFSVIIPIYENGTQKAKDRLLATLVGAPIALILFGTLGNSTLAPILLMASGYIGSYFTNYRYSTVFVTISAIGSAAIGSPVAQTFELTLYRLAFVALGIVLALPINRFVFPYKLKDITNELKTFYKETIFAMLNKVQQAAEGIETGQSMKNYLLVTSLLEDRIKLNNETIKNSEDLLVLEDEHELVNNIYELYIWVTTHQIKEIDLPIILKDIHHLTSQQLTHSGEVILEMKQHLKQLESPYDQIALTLIIEILEQEQNMRLK